MAGLIATVIIVLTFPLQMIKFSLESSKRIDHEKAYFTGTASCIECHKLEYDRWKGSHHDDAMDTATVETVLGNFNNAELEYNGITSRFYKAGEKFMVHTEGPDGEMDDFEIKYTFGVTPLQQYLIPFEGGRLQCLPIAWDTEKKEWFNLVEAVYPNEDIDHENWLHWTNFGQNWNGMCAECHSTHLQKNFDPETYTFNTTWFEIDVGCEACHGPGSAHIDWSNLPELARRQGNNFGLVVQTSSITSRQYVDLCARCHARRTALDDFDHSKTELLDQYIPVLVGEPDYFIDGQILEENYVYGSFVQSKMFINDVQCNDCHEVHSLKLLYDGNALCTQCHRPEVYDRHEHHFHKKAGEAGSPLVLKDKRYEVGEGALCINCHMPARYYMGNDLRNDHSFRLPRPDLSIDLGVPNACNDCHSDKDASWSEKYMTEWYGKSRRQHYGSVFAKGQQSDTAVIDNLIAIINAPEENYPFIIRATALSILSAFGDSLSHKVIKSRFADPEPLLRYTALRSFNPRSHDELLSSVAPLLNDPVRAVRQEAAMLLSEVPEDQMDSIVLRNFKRVLPEYIEAMLYTGDFAASQYNLGNLFFNLGETERSEEHYQNALRIDNEFYPAKVNLASLYSKQGNDHKAELLLRNVTRNHPGSEQAWYMMALLLAEKGEYTEALIFAEKAGELMPQNPRVFYNLGLLYSQTGDMINAEKALKEALLLSPDHPDYLYGLVYLYLQQGRNAKAHPYLLKLVELFPENRNFRQMFSGSN